MKLRHCWIDLSMRARDLPADLIREWAHKHAAANAKLEGREVPDDFIRSVQAEQFLNMRKVAHRAATNSVTLEEFLAEGPELYD